MKAAQAPHRARHPGPGRRAASATIASDAPTLSWSRRDTILPVCLFAGVLGLFARAIQCNFINFDDPVLLAAVDKLGSAELASGDSAGAVAAFRRALQLSPHGSIARPGLAEAMSRLGKEKP